MAGDSTSTVKVMNPHPLKIDVMKFDGKNNFGMWDVRWWMHWRYQISKTLYDWRKSPRLLLNRIGIRWIEWRVVW